MNWYLTFYIFYFLTLPSLCLKVITKDRPRNVIQSRIASGTIVDPPFKYPWIVSLFNGNSSTSTLFCGGSLIDSSHVLTAAHCTFGRNVNEVFAHVHRHDISLSPNDEDAQIRGIMKMIVHPKYDIDVQLDNDVAVWRLDQPLIGVTPLSLDKTGEFKDGSEVRVIGWGAKEMNGELSPTLLEADLYVISNIQCSIPYESPLVLISEMGLIQVGIVSFGEGCGDKTYPGVYTRISSVHEFIEQAILDESDNCTNIKCQNGGTCYNSINSFRCGCLDGYYGDYCETRDDSRSMYFGVIISISGNILISVALNLQKYSHNKNDKAKVSVPYMKRLSWWLGLILMLIGEVGNFLAYGFAPASVVAPLGTVALVSNAIIAPILLKEKFRIQDGIGIVFAIGGAIIIVVFSNAEEAVYNADELLEAMRKTKFIVYVIVTIVALIILLFFSWKMGDRFLFINMAIVGIFGGYTVIATKAVSTLLVEYVPQQIKQLFLSWIFYVMIFVVILTGVLQIRYLQKALQKFDSTEVIPSQFVAFTISAIISGGILYDDFVTMAPLNLGLFSLGIILTFAGVFLISRGRSTMREESKQLYEQANGEMKEKSTEDDDIENQNENESNETLGQNGDDSRVALNPSQELEDELDLELKVETENETWIQNMIKKISSPFDSFKFGKQNGTHVKMDDFQSGLRPTEKLNEEEEEEEEIEEDIKKKINKK